MPRLEILPDEPITRRSFLLLGAGSLAAASCQAPQEPILPYARQPPEIRPGRPLYYATSLVDDGWATGVLVESHVGRPTKIEGNPDHPASRGATGLRHQAAILDLYDPSRARQMRIGTQPTGWDQFVRTFGALPPDGLSGDGLHFVLPPITSPLLASLIGRIRTRLPGATFHFHAPLASPQKIEASRRAFGRPVDLQPHLERARVVALFDADPFDAGPAQVRRSRDWAAGRAIRDPSGNPSRLYVAEGDLGLAGAIADHRVRLKPSEIPQLLGAVATALLGRPPAPGPHTDWAAALAGDLLHNRGASLVLVGDRQPIEAHLIAHGLNAVIGAPMGFTDSAIFEGGLPSHGLDGLVAALDANAVKTLVLIDVDPVYDAPPALHLADKIAKVPQSVCVSLHETATARAAKWLVPSLHPLESWGDARAFDGTLSFIQPLIRPLYGGHGAVEVLAVFAGELLPDARALLRAAHPELDDAHFAQALQLGLVPGTASPETPLAVAPDLLDRTLAAIPPAPAGLEISLRPDPKLGDGCGAFNDWLLELPDPITRITWDNAALVSPATAEAHGWKEGDLLELQVEGGAPITIPAFPLRGVADDVVSVSLGWGRSCHGRTPVTVGVNAYQLRPANAGFLLPNAAARQLLNEPAVGRIGPEERELVVSQQHLEMHDRPILLHESLATFRADPDFAKEHRESQPSLYSSWPRAGQQWAMTVDLNTCTGCGTCVIACQAENNIPVVGKVGVRKGRLMHWIRIDRYFLGEAKSADTVQLLPQPMMCQHCEQAPCEYVCPVNATVHSPDGLNEMVYNRCIGTRFCSNNCPYKVRRFNWLEYNGDLPETVKMQKNPNVTVRARGVMEKCTYCVQRIRLAEIEARIERRPIAPVQTACQAACPTGAIVFGLLSDPQSDVSKSRESKLAYGVLEHELGTEPRTRYLAHLRNENEEVPAR